MSSKYAMTSFSREYGWWLLLAVGAVLLAVVVSADSWLRLYPADKILPVADLINRFIDTYIDSFKVVTRAVSALLEWPMQMLQTFLQWLPWPVTVLAVCLLALHLGGTRLMLLCAVALLYIALSGYWRQAMNTMALVGIAVPLSLLIGVAVGIWAQKTRIGNQVVPPVLDLMQTMPTFAYLVPLLVLFGFGPVVGLIASAIYACPPMVRNVSLGLKQIPKEIIDASVMSGSTSRQQLFWVEMPAAIAQIKIGINQTIMAALSMVIIASVIGGFDDIGWEVLSTMRKARFGESVLAGAVIVFLAIVIDRLSLAYASGSNKQNSMISRLSAPWWWLLVLSPLLLLVILKASGADTTLAEPDWTGAVSNYLDTSLNELVASHGELLTTLKNNFFFYYLLPLKIGLNQTIQPFTWGIEFTSTGRALYWLLGFAACTWLCFIGRWRTCVGLATALYLLYFGFSGIAWPVLIAASGLLAWQLGSTGLALFVVAALGFILLTGMWERAMLSLYLCTAAAFMSFILGSSLGVWAAASDRVSALLRPIADTFQTLPQFVFLIPVLMFFQVGEFTALLAIIAYAFVPALRYTEAGLRQVSPQLLEVAVEQGCTNRQIFWQIKLPLALPSIMVGVNQTIMYAFAMLVIAALVGTTGLGQQIFLALSAADTGLGLVAGLAMALLAMIADRLMQAWSDRQLSG